MASVYIGVGLIAVAVFGLVLALSFGSGGPTGVAKSLAMIEGVVTQRSAVKTELDAKDRLVEPIFNRAQRIATVLSPQGTSDRLARGLERAGNPSPWTAERVMGAKGVALLIGLLLGVAYGGFSLRGFVFALGFGGAAFWLPNLLVYNAALRRQEQVATGLAEALDMLTVCVEAGQGFDAALVQVARSTDGPISGEFARVLSEVQIGKSRSEAFAGLGDRVSLSDVKNFVSAIIQADKLGIPIASVLREQTAAMRLSRRQRAEEKAQKVTVKILFPLLLCIFPAMFVVILGPGIIRMITTLFGGNLL
ncbi:type II secretion system F family protein [Intrasporangium calvum]|uniref:Type II secretion system F domain n=1 Tax=Intrasporangium calvum (strain ATCC 23552 / DSM 43043 / JCM 3097 / NBRC 12989 / NCIMB 10167 / NRRL B-3866 / 7 KIP) TaxID=710696 RepID=E6S8T3_INTC7|nr:type II secretion system F family protein [Intrasporangium calvum]ADU47052.1 Type II secretion system F domain [Intrasporangium calvum DSM 43043]